MDKEKLEYYAQKNSERIIRIREEEELRRQEESELVQNFEEMYDYEDKGYNITSIFERKFGENIFKKVILICDDNSKEKLSKIQDIIDLSNNWLITLKDDLLIELSNGKKFRLKISEFLYISF